MKYFCIIATMFFVACSPKVNPLVGSWIEPITGFETSEVQGITLKDDSTATSINMATLQYTSWLVQGNNLVLWGRSIGNGQVIEFKDTMQIVSCTADSLILSSAGGYVVRYHRVDRDKLKELNGGRVDVVDSLALNPNYGDVQQRIFTGAIAIDTASMDTLTAKVPTSVTLYSQRGLDNGVFTLERQVGGGVETVYGRFYQVFDMTDYFDAYLYQLLPFEMSAKPINFIYYKDSYFELVNDQRKRYPKAPNFALRLQE